MNVSAVSLIDRSGIDARAAYCLDLIREAGGLALDGFIAQSNREIELKGPQDYLTETDLAVEEHLKSAVAREFPGDGFLGEETGGSVSGDCWVVDPIDGTANFARSIPHYCTAIAFVSDNQIAFGAIYNPSLGELYFARRGAGALRNGNPIHVAGTAQAAAASVELGWSNRRPNEAYLDIISAALANGANVRRVSSGALGLAYVADGRSDGYAELHMNAWDCLAGLLMVREAGGVVGGTALSGNLTAGGSVLAATPRIADMLSASSGIPVSQGP